MTNNTDAKTLEFIQLIKCIIEYYATTKKEKTDDFDSATDETEDLLNSLQGLGLDDIIINIPTEIDSAIKNTFLSQLSFFEEHTKTIKNTKE